MKKLINTKIFIEKAKQVHGDKYDYSLVNYINGRTKVKIICRKHGIFEQLPFIHYKHGCLKCYNDSRNLTKEQFINKANKIHNNNYNYSLVNYINCKTKVKIICKKHGIFEQIPSNHIYNKNGCPKCSNNNFLLNTNYFIEKSKNIYGDRYDYSLVDYKNNKTKVKIICKKHGIFEQTPHYHYNHGCPKCSLSKGELAIEQYLKKHNIKFIQQYKFNDCKDKFLLSFDFYLPDYNTCIEYDGEQHFKPYRFDNKNIMNIKLEKTKKHDKIKTDYCINNNIRLIRIKYNENIEDVLNKVIL